MLDCALTATSCRVASHRSGLGRLQSQGGWLVGSRGRGLLRWAWPGSPGICGPLGPRGPLRPLQQFGLPSRLCLRPPPGGAHDLLSSWLLRRRSRVRVGGPVTCRARAWGAGPASVTDAIGLWLPATDTDPERHGGRGVYRGDASETEGGVRLGAGASSMSSAAGEGQPVTSRRPLRLNGRQPFPGEAPAGRPHADDRHRRHTRSDSRGSRCEGVPQGPLRPGKSPTVQRVLRGLPTGSLSAHPVSHPPPCSLSADVGG